jgi:hypothetical protein
MLHWLRPAVRSTGYRDESAPLMIVVPDLRRRNAATCGHGGGAIGTGAQRESARADHLASGSSRSVDSPSSRSLSEAAAIQQSMCTVRRSDLTNHTPRLLAMSGLPQMTHVSVYSMSSLGRRTVSYLPQRATYRQSTMHAIGAWGLQWHQ